MKGGRSWISRSSPVEAKSQAGRDSTYGWQLWPQWELSLYGRPDSGVGALEVSRYRNTWGDGTFRRVQEEREPVAGGHTKNLESSRRRENQRVVGVRGHRKNLDSKRKVKKRRRRSRRAKKRKKDY